MSIEQELEEIRSSDLYSGLWFFYESKGNGKFHFHQRWNDSSYNGICKEFGFCTLSACGCAMNYRMTKQVTSVIDLGMCGQLGHSLISDICNDRSIALYSYISEGADDDVCKTCLKLYKKYQSDNSHSSVVSSSQKDWEDDWKQAPGNSNWHYDGAIQPVEYFASVLPQSIRANIIKYVTRYARKNGKEDLLKALWYLDWQKRIENGDFQKDLCAGDYIAAQDFNKEQKEIVLSMEELEVETFDKTARMLIINRIEQEILSLIAQEYPDEQ